jgi:hypothetical protein
MNYGTKNYERNPKKILMRVGHRKTRSATTDIKITPKKTGKAS